MGEGQVCKLEGVGLVWNSLKMCNYLVTLQLDMNYIDLIIYWYFRHDYQLTSNLGHDYL